MKKLLVILLIICCTQNDLLSQIDWVGTGQMLKTDKKVSIAESTAEADDIASKSKTSIIANNDRFGLFVGNKSNPKELDETFPEGGWCFPDKYPEDVFALYSASPMGYAGYFDGKLGICGAQINFFEPFSDGIANDVEWRLLASSEEFKIMSGNTIGRFLLNKEIGIQSSFARILVDHEDMKVAMEVVFDEWGENQQLFQLRTDGRAYFPGKIILGYDSEILPTESIDFLVNPRSRIS